MNARLYDPILHRFLSPDNIIQDPFNTQDYNRYAYVLNNPLKYNDPTGNARPQLEPNNGGGNSAAFNEFLNANFSGPLPGFGNNYDTWSATNWMSNPNYGKTIGFRGFTDSEGRYHGETSYDSRRFIEVKVPPIGHANNNVYLNGGNGFRWPDWTYGIPVLGSAAESGNNLADGNYVGAAANFGMALVELFTAGAASEYKVAARTVKSGIKYTKSSLQLGQQIHKAYKAGLHNPAKQMFKEFVLPSGRRIDFLDASKGIIYELKPFNPRAMKEGQNQLNLYMRELQTMPEFKGINWKTVLETY